MFFHVKFLVAEKRMAKAKRKYNDTFLDYGFTFTEKVNEQLPQCLISFKTLSNASMKANQQKQHLSNTHPQFIDKNRSFFEMKASSLNKNEIGQYRTISDSFKGDSDCVLRNSSSSG